MRALTALIVSDGRPGHYHLSEGIVAALGRRARVEIVRLEVERRRLVPSRALAAALGAGVGPTGVLRLGYGLAATAVPEADVVVSAGGNTLAANIAAARLRGVPNMFYGSLRAYPADAFALVLTSYADQVRRPHPVMTLKPSALDPDTIPPAGAVGRRRIGVLVGGDGGGVAWGEDDWAGLIAVIEGLACVGSEGGGCDVVVSNSRRTPDAVSDRLKALANGLPGVDLVDVRAAGLGTLGELLAGCDLVLVGANSSSMLSEAIWARRPTIALLPATSALPVREAAYRAHLEGNGWCDALPVAGLDIGDLLWRADRLKPLAENPLDMLAATIAAQVPGLFEPVA